MTDQELGEEQSEKGVSAKLILVAIVAVGLAAFVVQNTNDTPVEWLVFDGSAPLWLVIVSSSLAGAVLSATAGWLSRRSRRRR